MFVFLFLLILLSGIFLKDNKKFWIICLVMLIVLANTTNDYADYKNYEVIFERSANGEIDQYNGNTTFGWYFLSVFLYNIGLNYRGMVVVVIAFSIFLINQGIKMLDIKKSLFFSLFIVFPGLIHCVQLRFFLGFSIVFYGLVRLLKEKEKCKRDFILCVIIAYFIHSSCIIFLLFLLLPIIKKYDYKVNLFLIVILICLIYFGAPYISDSIIKPFISFEKYERYFVSDISQTTISWFLQIFSVWLICVGLAIYFDKILDKFLDLDKKSMFINIVNAIIILGITIAFLVFDRNFHRFLEMGYMLLYIMLSYIWKKYKIDYGNKILGLLVFFAIIFGITYIYAPFETVIKPFFTFDGFNKIIR